MKTIVVPLDGSALAEQVLPYVRLLAPILSARVHLLVVITEEQKQRLIASYAATASGNGGQGEADWRWERGAHTELTHAAEEYLNDLVLALREAGLDVTYEVTGGAPAECIVDIAASEVEAMVAMATHGYSGLRRWTLGSVADKVVQIAATPIFLLRVAEQMREGALSLKRILVPLDGSALAERALPLAIELARRARAELLLLQVAIPLVEYVGGVSPFNRRLPPTTTFPDMLREQAQQQLSATINRFGSREVAMTPVVVFGNPAEAIVDEALAYQADLIIMATHGYGGLKRFALGSVADKVLHASTVPLLLVRGQGEQRPS